MRMQILFVALVLLRTAMGSSIASLPLLPPDEAVQAKDWLVQPISAHAQVYRTAEPNEIALSNGLARRTFRIAPNAATVGLRELVSGESILRGVKPEAVVRINGTVFEVGGLKGQPDRKSVV